MVSDEDEYSSLKFPKQSRLNKIMTEFKRDYVQIAPSICILLVNVKESKGGVLAINFHLQRWPWPPTAVKFCVEMCKDHQLWKGHLGLIFKIFSNCNFDYWGIIYNCYWNFQIISNNNYCNSSYDANNFAVHFHFAIPIVIARTCRNQNSNQRCQCSRWCNRF